MAVSTKTSFTYRSILSIGLMIIGLSLIIVGIWIDSSLWKIILIAVGAAITFFGYLSTRIISQLKNHKCPICKGTGSTCSRACITCSIKSSKCTYCNGTGRISKENQEKTNL
ncbi:MAG: hypothetical protein KAS95_03695 [Candidatus Heimdallarchaeota archaeon]|nr:hypothetical protein [Candidatus Heimdallarchaeota archaeon]